MSARLALALLTVWFALTAAASPGAPPRVLLLSGANNHDWRATTPALKALLEADGRFAVDVETNVPAIKPETFKNYDAVLSNFNTFGQAHPGPIWSPDVRAAFERYIREGHGLIVVHAGSSVFYDWPAFQQIAGATWANGTSHGKIHTNEVHFGSAPHPITDGLGDFTTNDEFWQHAQIAPGAQVLATVTPKPEFGGTGQPEAICLVTEYGRGRGFALLLGHNPQAMANDGFQRLLRRGAEWAACGRIKAP